MFLHIKSLLLKIHPYFSQYVAYLRNMRMTKKEALVSTTESLKQKRDINIASLMKCSHSLAVYNVKHLWYFFMNAIWIIYMFYWVGRKYLAGYSESWRYCAELTPPPVVLVELSTMITLLSPQFKKFGKIRLGSKLLLGFIYGLSFQIQAASNFPQSWVKKPV